MPATLCPQDAFVRRLIQVLRSPPAQATQRLQTTLRNLQSLHQLLAPFGPPQAAPDQQLLSEIDMALMADLVARISDALRQSMQPALPAAASQQGQQQSQQQSQQQQGLQQQQPAAGLPGGAEPPSSQEQRQVQATPSPAASAQQQQQSVHQQVQQQQSTDLGSADRTMLDANGLGIDGGEGSVALKSEPEAAMEVDG